MAKTCFNPDRVRKLLRLALCPAAQNGEIENAAVKLIQYLRENNISAEHFLGEEKSSRPSILMPFGKYKGIPITEIDQGYLEWTLKNVQFKDNRLRAEIQRVIKMYEEDEENS